MTKASAQILVTGAGGFIGSALLRPLAETYGAVLAGIRRKRPELSGQIKILSCDLDHPAEVHAAMRGVDLVIHAAYGDEAAMSRQCKTLLDAMSQAGTPSLIALSSIAIYGLRAGSVAETTPPAPPLGRYAREKSQCEAQIVNWSAGDEKRRAIVLRPGIVYGAHSPLWIEKMAARIASGGWGVFGRRGEGHAALIHVDDLAQQVLAASRLLTGPQRLEQPHFRPLNAVGPEAPSWNGYFAALARATGAAPLRQWSQGELALRQALGIPAKIARRLHLPFGTAASLAPTPGEMELFALKADYSGAAAAKALGFLPRIGLAEGLARSLPASRDSHFDHGSQPEGP